MSSMRISSGSGTLYTIFANWTKYSGCYVYYIDNADSTTAVSYYGAAESGDKWGNWYRAEY